MTRPRYVPQRKRRTREHVIADLSVNHVERHALLCGYAVERIVHDYGIDLIVYTFDARGEVEGGQINVQLKSTDRLRSVEQGTMVTCRLERADLRAWMAEPMPVMLALFDAKTETAFWLYVQAHFAQQWEAIGGRSGSLTVRIPREKLANAAAFRRFAEFRDRLLTQSQGIVHHEE